MNALRALGGWLYDRLGLELVGGFILNHKVPPDHATRWGWAYVFGMSTVTAFAVQIATGIGLASAYVPTPDHAYESLAYITYEWSWGWFLRGMHFFGASAMVLLMCIHMARVAIMGAYKYPREMQWITGVMLFGFVGVMAWTGQLLRWNEDGYWTVVVGARFAERVPLIGPWFAAQVLGGETVGGPTLTRFFALHVMILPLIILSVLAVHLYMVLANGISELPKAGRPVDPRTYKAWYRRMEEVSGTPYVPNTIWREIVAATVVVLVIVALAWGFGARPLGNPPDPTVLRVDPRPDWFVVWYYALLWVKPRGAEDLFMVYLPILTFLAMFAVPILFNRGERAPSRRPWAVAIVLGAFLFFGSLIVLGAMAPWVPAVSTEPLTREQLGPVDDRILRGAALFAEKGCQYCHTVQGIGGSYGPSLTDVSTRLQPEDIAVRTLMGIRDMPAYRDTLTGDELADIVHFLMSLEAR